MAPLKGGKAPIKASKPKKEKIFHPESRKAGQLARKQLRTGKLTHAASKRNKKSDSQVDVYGFFYHAMPSEGVMSLPELHSIVRDVWLTRHDAELEEERTLRRKGRPQSVKEIRLEEIKLRECEEYRTGFEVIDLTHTVNVDLFRHWDQKEIAYIQMLRFIRISNEHTETAVVSKPGKHFKLLGSNSNTEISPPPRMDLDEKVAPPLIQGVQGPLLPMSIADSPSQFASSMMAMDGPL